MDNLSRLINIIGTATGLWATIMYIKDNANITGYLGPETYLYMIMLSISAIFFFNLKLISRWWINFIQKISPTERLKKLDVDVSNLRSMEVDFHQTREGEIVPIGDPKDLRLAEYVIEQLNSICKIKLPHVFKYKLYFRTIHIFVRRGNVNQVKKITRDFDDFYVEDPYK